MDAVSLKAPLTSESKTVLRDSYLALENYYYR